MARASRDLLLQCPDMERAAAFYQKAFGFGEIMRQDRMITPPFPIVICATRSA